MSDDDRGRYVYIDEPERLVYPNVYREPRDASKEATPDYRDSFVPYRGVEQHGVPFTERPELFAVDMTLSAGEDERTVAEPVDSTPDVDPVPVRIVDDSQQLRVGHTVNLQTYILDTLVSVPVVGQVADRDSVTLSNPSTVNVRVSNNPECPQAFSFVMSSGSLLTFADVGEQLYALGEAAGGLISVAQEFTVRSGGSLR